jgi:hypothetical protein
MTLRNKDNSPVIGTRTKLLKTGYPNGKRVEINIAQCPDYVLFDTDNGFDFLESMPVIKDKNSILNNINMTFSTGQFHIKCTYDQYPKVIIAFTKYLFDLVFSAMEKVEEKEAKDDNTDTSNSGDTDSGRNKAGNPSGDDGEDKTEKPKSLLSSVLGGSGRGKQTKGSGKDSK